MQLRNQGQPYREIAQTLNVGLTTAYRWVNPTRTAPYRNGRVMHPERARERDRHGYRTYRKDRGQCSQCEGPMSLENDGGTCPSCRQAKVHARALQFEQWWNEGLKMREIADQLGWTKNHVAMELGRLREKGYNLPLRLPRKGEPPMQRIKQG